MSGAAVVSRHGLTFPKTGARILFAGGLALTGWLLGAVLSTPASADEQTPVTPETSVVQPANEAGSGKTATPEESTSDSSATGTTKAADTTETPKTESPKEEPAPVSAKEPATEPEAASSESTVEEKAVSNASSVEKSSSPEPEKKTSKPQASGGLLGGLLGGVLNLVTNTVGGVVETVGGVLGGISEHVVEPIVKPGPCCGSSNPGLLPGAGDVLDPVFGGGSGQSAGGSVTIAVPAKTATTPASEPITPDPRPFVPATPPTPAPAVQNHRLAALPVQLKTDPKPAQAGPAASDTHASPDGGGSGGGGGLPNTPATPVAPTTSAQPGHDHSGGGRGPLAVLDSGMPATQLKLIGAGCDHEGERTGREAALPATSPD
ncbi:hypothetical protein [Amycolatopsis azurea]|uniref:hypothetical protein n=1 Tax=Amycolatopsis azurea TaxID=36819 RepID=UPI00117779AB|nr:hypothetical protein [Amycolatopsis azurea]